MNAMTRILFLKVIDGQQEILPTMYQLSSYRDCDGVLLWLIKNKLTGKNFKEWFIGNFESSVLNMIKWVEMKRFGEKEYKPILGGRDWLV